MAQDHYIYVVWATCRDELTSEGVKLCKCYQTDLCGVRESLEEAMEIAQQGNTDDDDNPVPLGPWSSFYDGRIRAHGIHDEFIIMRTYNHPFPCI